MTTNELDEQLQQHYASFLRGHVHLRERMLEEIQQQPADSAGGRIDETSRFFNRRLLMRLSAAAVVALAIGITVFLITPGSQGTSWAEVVKAIGPIETIQYRTSEPTEKVSKGEVLRTIRVNYLTPNAERVDTWVERGSDNGPDKVSTPDQTFITVGDERERTQYEVFFSEGRPGRITQSVDYVSSGVAATLGRKGVEHSSDVLEMWKRLHDLPPEAVLKRGSKEVGGQRLLRFEVIDAGRLPGLSLPFNSSAQILVNPRTKQPVMLEAGLTQWTDLRFNEPIPTERFAPPTVPDDLDADVCWSFTILAETWNKSGFVFRVLDAEGKPIITKDDVKTAWQLPPDPEGGPIGGERPSPTVMSGFGTLSPEGVDKLDRFMARNPGAEMTIEITGEQPVKRKVYGRLSRQPQPGGGEGGIRFLISSLADLKASTQPSEVAPAPGMPAMRGRGPARGFSPGGPGGVRPGAR